METVHAELVPGRYVRVEIRKIADSDGSLRAHAVATVPDALLDRWAKAGLQKTTYELTTILGRSAGNARDQWAIDLLVCDVVGDVRRDFHLADTA